MIYLISFCIRNSEGTGEYKRGILKTLTGILKGIIWSENFDKKPGRKPEGKIVKKKISETLWCENGREDTEGKMDRKKRETL